MARKSNRVFSSYTLQISTSYRALTGASKSASMLQSGFTIIRDLGNAGFTRGKALKVDAPTIEESPIHVECKVFSTLEVPPMRTLFLANVEITTVQEHVCDEQERLIVSAVPFFGMTVGSGEFFTMGKQVGHIGQSVGKDDIKY